MATVVAKHNTLRTTVIINILRPGIVGKEQIARIMEILAISSRLHIAASYMYIASYSFTITISVHSYCVGT